MCVAVVTLQDHSRSNQVQGCEQIPPSTGVEEAETCSQVLKHKKRKSELEFWWCTLLMRGIQCSIIMWWIWGKIIHPTKLSFKEYSNYFNFIYPRILVSKFYSLWADLIVLVNLSVCSWLYFLCQVKYDNILQKRNVCSVGILYIIF